MRIDASFLGWGIFFVLVGVVPLAVQGGYLLPSQVDEWWRFWPLLLIGAGLALILRRTALEPIGGLLVAGTFGLMVGAGLSAGIGGFTGSVCGAGDSTAFSTTTGTFAGTTPVEVEVDLDCGELVLGVGAGTTWSVAGEDGHGRGPSIDAGPDHLSIDRGDSGDGPFELTSPSQRWDVALPTGIVVDLQSQVNAGSARYALEGAELTTVDLQANAASTVVDLTSAEIGTLDVELNAGSLGLTLPSTSLSGTIEANAAAVRICAPAGVALRLQTDDSVLTAFDYDGRDLVLDGATWESPGYDTASVRIDLRTGGNAASFVLDPAEGCDG